MWFLLLAVMLAQGPPLSERHRAWLEEEIHFLISSRERAQFLELPSDEARDRFTQEFWKRRDPTPGTVRNEARELHLKLLGEADRLFTLVEARRGRFTERGRVYQLLGPPQSRQDYTHASNRLFPLELWQYVGRTEAFLPGSFYLIFFRQGGFGDYRLWSPSTDGPQALIASHEPGRFLLQQDYAFRALKSIDYELAMAVQRLVPGEAEDLPAFASESLLTNLEKYADISERYVRVTEQVTSVATFQHLSVSAWAIALFDSTGIPQVHYVLEVPSENVNWISDEERVRTSFGLSCRVLDGKRRELDAIEDGLDLVLTRSEKQALEGVPLSFQGRLILPPDDYTLEFELTNTPGGATEVVSVPVAVPDAAGPVASDIVLARSRSGWEAGAFSDHRPFQLGDILLSPSPDHMFLPTEALAYVQLRGFSTPAPISWRLLRAEAGNVVWESGSRFHPGPGSDDFVEQVVPLRGLEEGSYSLVFEFPGGSREASFTIHRSGVPQKVRVLSRESLPAGHARIRFQRGVLFARQGKTGRAIEEMTEAARLLPRDLEVHLKLAFLLNAAGEHQRSVDLLKPLEPHYPREPDLLVLLGFASLKVGNYSDAVSYYERVVAEKPGDKRLRAALSEARKLAERSSDP